MKSQNPRCKKDLSPKHFNADRFHEGFDDNQTSQSLPKKFLHMLSKQQMRKTKQRLNLTYRRNKETSEDYCSEKVNKIPKEKNIEPKYNIFIKLGLKGIEPFPLAKTKNKNRSRSYIKKQDGKKHEHFILETERVK